MAYSLRRGSAKPDVGAAAVHRERANKPTVPVGRRVSAPAPRAQLAALPRVEASNEPLPWNVEADTPNAHPANDPLDSIIYCRLGHVVIPTVTAFARYLKSLHGPRVAFDRSPGYWLVRGFGVPVARYRVKATNAGLTFERVPFSKRQRAELRAL